MFTGWVRRFGLAIAVLGLVGVAAGAWWPAAPEDLATASVGAATTPEEAPSWRSALMLAGGICVVAGAGLVLLAIFPDRARRG